LVVVEEPTQGELEDLEALEVALAQILEQA
jgi:hypothetical protein